MVSSVALAGTATADGHHAHVFLQDLDFDPEPVEIDLDADGRGAVTFHQVDEDPGGIVHDVDIHHESMHGHIVSKSLHVGDTYHVSVQRDGTNLVVDGQTTKTVDFSGGSVTLHAHCNLHPGMELDEGITVTA